LRALRHKPPGLAVEPDRRLVFGAALEQAEQLFATAALAGYASRPISLFYGLSQAGRAIAAASRLATDDDWKLKGHGITAPNLDDDPELPLLTLVNQGKRKGSFTQLASLLKSGTLPQQTSFGHLWRVIPELVTSPLADDSESPPVLLVTPFTVTEDYGIVKLVGFPRRLAAADEAQVVQFLGSYPTLSGLEAHPDHGPPGFHPDGYVQALRGWRWPSPEDRDMTRLIERLTLPYRDSRERRAFPALGGDTAAIHPLIAWWAILYALSMLARYVPASWTRHINVDVSVNAVPLETALDQALDTCPRLILHAIQTASE
jgi:hypothetical protein